MSATAKKSRIMMTPAESAAYDAKTELQRLIVNAQEMVAALEQYEDNGGAWPRASINGSYGLINTAAAIEQDLTVAMTRIRCGK